jgi:hypothetical protein
LVNSKIAACTANDFIRRICVNELEAVAKRVPLTSYRLNRQRSERKREVQLHDLTHGNFHREHGCNSRLANVHGMARQHTARPGLDTDGNRELESGLGTSVVNQAANVGGGLFLSSHLNPPRLAALSSQRNRDANNRWPQSPYFERNNPRTLQRFVHKSAELPGN